MCSIFGVTSKSIPEETLKQCFDRTISRGPDMSRFEEIKRWQIVVTNPDGIDEMTLNIEASEFKRRDELLQQFREKIKLRPELKVLAPGSLPPQVRPIDDKRHWD